MGFEILFNLSLTYCAYVLGKFLQWLAKKLAVSISIIRKLAVVFLFVKIQNILIRNVWKTQKFAISLSIKTFKILKVTRILGQISFLIHFQKVGLKDTVF